MKIFEISESNVTLTEYISSLTEEPVIITRDGQPIAALVAFEDADMETITLSANPKFIALIEQSRVRRRAEGGISSTEMRRRLGLSQV